MNKFENNKLNPMDRVNQVSLNQKIYNDLKDAFKEMGFPIKEEKREGYFMMFFSEMKYFEEPAPIIIIFDPPHNTITMTIHYGVVPLEKMEVLYEMINQINIYLCTCHFILTPQERLIALLSGLLFRDGSFDKSQFQMFFDEMMSEAFNYAPLIGRQLDSERKPAELFLEYLTENKERII